MIRVVISPEALDDLRGIGDWIARDAPARAARFLERIKVRFDLIAEHPEIGRRRDEFGDGIRSIVHGKYVIFYRRGGGDVEIVRVMHVHRDFRGGIH